MSGLKGENQIRKFRKIAEEIVAQIAGHEDVAGVILGGGLVRGFTDKHSDVDIIVLLCKKNASLKERILRIASTEQKRFGVDIDLEVHYSEDFKERKWDEMDRWDFSQTEIAFDRNGETRKILADKTKVTDGFWRKRIVVYAEYLKWHCCPSENGVGTIVEMWIDRGDLVSAQYCLSYALDLLIGILFALNKQFLPPPKWRIYYSYNLPWLPTNYKKLLQEALTAKASTRNDINRRLKALRQMWVETLPALKAETGLTPKLISKFYRDKVLRQS